MVAARPATAAAEFSSLQWDDPLAKHPPPTAALESMIHKRSCKLWSRMVYRASDRRAVIDLLVSKYAGSFSGKKPRALYSEEEKAVISAMLHDAQGNVQIVADACKQGGFCSLDRATIRRIQQGRTPLRGRPVNKDFEQLVVSIVRSQNPSGNVSSSTLRTTANCAKQDPQYRECPIVQRLQFSRKWARGIWQRHFVRSNQCEIQCHKTEM